MFPLDIIITFHLPFRMLLFELFTFFESLRVKHKIEKTRRNTREDMGNTQRNWENNR